MTQYSARPRPQAPARIPRARCVTTAFVLLVTWPVAIVLFVLWTVSVVLSIFTMLMPLMVGCTALVRRYAEAHRRWAARIIGIATAGPPTVTAGGAVGPSATWPLPPEYAGRSARPAPPGPGAPSSAQRSSSAQPPSPPQPPPASAPPGSGTPSSPSLFARAVGILRDPTSWRRWLWLLVHAIVTPALACLALSLLGSTLLYLAYPLLFALTPEHVFANPFGLFELHTAGEALWMMPLGVVAFGLWFALAPSLLRAQAAVTDGLLGPRHARVPS